MFYVDDIIVLTAETDHISDIFDMLNAKYEMPDLRVLQNYLGIELNGRQLGCIKNFIQR